MSGLVYSLALWLLVAVSAWNVGTSSSSAAEPLETSGNIRFIVYASRQNADEAIGLARRFGSDFGPPTVISTTNGWYAVAAGPISVPDPVALKKKLSESWWPPKDTFFSKGQTFIEKVWESPKSPILATASSSENDPHIASAAGLEVHVGSNFVRVRAGAKDVASATFDDNFNSTSASIVRLDNSSPLPQVVAAHFTGGAHCCTQMKVLTFIAGRWQVVKIGEFDSDGPQIEDLNGDGSVELVGKDDSFDYAFASYAESYAPPKILRLVHNRVIDVSKSSEYQRPILQMLLANQGLATPDMWRDNGFLAGWVAHNSLVGNGAEAWRKMLDLYDRNSDWDLSVCTVATKGFDPCPDYAKRIRDFPTALREHLAQYGYSIDGIVTAPAPVPSVRPSFDCNKARTPSEIQICRSPQLAELDNILAAGYAFLKSTQGRPAADAIGVPYWRLIAQCQGDESCIARRQIEEISALALAGAPVSVPAWAPARPAPPQPQPTNPPPPPAPEVARATEEPPPAPKPDHEASSGSGFFVTADGDVVTNAHVIENCSTVRVTTDQGAAASAKVIARDMRNDLALLSTGLPAKKTAAFRTSIRLGEAVEAFGYPLT
jgi:uncharacterized protein